MNPVHDPEEAGRRSRRLDALIALDRTAPTLTDDGPFNEYFFLRRWLAR